MELSISRCHAWAPGINTAEQWQRWAQGQLLLSEQDTPGAKAVPAMMRRRLTRWGRMSLETACACADDMDANTPILFSSRHGDLQRTLGLLRDIAAEQPLSPTAFSLSVHNSSLGIFTIVQQALGTSLAVAAGKDSLAHAMLEAGALLAEGEERVLLVHTDDVVPEFYRDFADEPDMPCSIALMLKRKLATGESGRVLALKWHPGTGSEAHESMASAFLRWWFGGLDALRYPGSRLDWSWAIKNDCKDFLFY